MPRLVWTPQALRDVERLHAFLAPKNRDAAKRAIRAIRRDVKLLGRYPEIGRRPQHLPAEFRQLFIPFGNSGYVVLYRLDGGTAVLLAIRHGREAGFETPKSGSEELPLE